MEREELLQQVNESLEGDGKQLSSTLSEESINGELDDALEDISDDEENNKKVIAKLAKRLLRMDGNLHSNVSKEVKAYKNAHPKKTDTPEKKDEKDGEGDDKYAKLLERLEKMEKAQLAKTKQEVKETTVANVKKGLEAKFKGADIEVNNYIMKQTLRDLEIPDSDDDKIDEDGLIKKAERAYYKNLKEAGLDKRDTDKPRFGGKGGKQGESAADRFWAKKGKKEGWKK